jgi:hypothetical protein
MDDDGNYNSIECLGAGDRDKGVEPCPEFAASKCKRMGNLLIILPLVAADGVFQIDTSSVNSIIDINSGIENIVKMSKEYGKPVRFFPCMLRIVSRQTTAEGTRKAIHTMTLTLANHDRLRELRGKMEEIHAILSGDGSEAPALPPAEQSKYEEKDLMPSDVYKDEEPYLPENVTDAEVVGEVTVPPKSPSAASKPPSEPLNDLISGPPQGIPKDVKDAWDNIVGLALGRGVKTWSKMSEEVSTALQRGIPVDELKYVGKENLRLVYQHLKAMDDKG